MGKGFEMDTTRGGYCLNPLVSISELKNLPTVSPSNPVLSSFYNTIFLTRMALKGEAAVIGYVGGPFTLMTYLIEKSSNGLFEFTKKWINTFEKESHQLLDFITDNLFLHIIEQIKSGAQIIQIFEMFSETLTPEDFQLFSYNYIEKLALKIKDSFKNNVPLILYAKGQNPFVKKILKDKREFPFDGVNFDSNCDLDEMAELCEQCNIALIGNLDPGVLMGSNKIIEQKTLRMLKSGKKCGKYIAGLGQGVFEEINPKNVQKFVQCIRNYK